LYPRRRNFTDTNFRIKFISCSYTSTAAIRESLTEVDILIIVSLSWEYIKVCIFSNIQFLRLSTVMNETRQMVGKTETDVLIKRPTE
jgi:hypothetical protein